MDINKKKKTLAELEPMLLAFEEEHNLGERSYKGIYYWNLIRSVLPVHLFENLGAGAYISTKDRNYFFFKRFAALLKACLYNIFHPKELDRADILMVYDNAFKNVDGEQINPFLDYIETDHSVQRITLTQSFIVPSAYQKFPNNAFTQLWLTVVLRLYRWRILKLRKEERRFIDELERNINQTFGANLHRLERIIYSTLLYRTIYTRHVRRLLKRVQPKLVMLVNYSAVHNAVMCEECRRMDIPCAEMLHGVFLHDSGFYVLKKPYFTPKYVFTFGEYTKGLCPPGQYCKAVATGSPFRDAQLKRIGDFSPDEKSVVFYSEPFMERYIGFIGEFCDIVKPYGYKVFIKLRPINQDTETMRYETLKERGVTLLPAYSNTYDIIASYKHHVGLITTLLFEALTDRTRVYMPEDDTNISMRRDFERYGFFTVVSSPGDLAAKIRTPDAQSVDTTSFWTPDAISNIRRAIDDILAGKTLE